MNTDVGPCIPFHTSLIKITLRETKRIRASVAAVDVLEMSAADASGTNRKNKDLLRRCLVLQTAMIECILSAASQQTPPAAVSLRFVSLRLSKNQVNSKTDQLQTGARAAAALHVCVSYEVVCPTGASATSRFKLEFNLGYCGSQKTGHIRVP